MKRKTAYGPARPTGYQKANVKRRAVPARQNLLFQPRLLASKNEKKNIDVVTTNSLVAASTVGVVIPINTPCIEGSNPNQHIGRATTLHSLLLRWRVSLAPTTAGTASLRCLVVYDKQTNATAPTAATVLQVDSITSPQNLGYSRRFTTILDEMVPCIGTGGPQSVMLNLYRKFALPCEFNGTNGGTIGDVLTGGLFAILYQSGGLVTAAPTDVLHTRVRFSDS